MKTCKRCIYNESIPKISFDEKGICNYCKQFDQMEQEYPTGEHGKQILEAHIKEVKEAGKGKKYDVVIGVSGGCDSSFMLHLAHRYGLRVLAAHFDNTYNSRIAVENIQIVLNKLGFDLFTYVVDNKEYQKIYKSFFKASVPEIDTPTDISLATVHYIAAARHGIKYIWEGHSFRTEGISPPGWFYMDAQYVKTIHKKFGDGKIKSLPVLWMSKWLKWMLINKIRKFRPLYYLDYNKEETKMFLEKEYGWQWYGGHHMENRSAYFVNNYYLPRKFNIDLRYCEYSALIRSGQIQREEGLEKMKLPKPFDEEIKEEIKTRVGFTDQEWEAIMNDKPLHFTNYKTYKETFEKMRPFFFLLYKSGYVTKSFYTKYCIK